VDSYSWPIGDDVLLDDVPFATLAIALSRAATIATDAHRVLAPLHLAATTTITTDTHRFRALLHLAATTTITRCLLALFCSRVLSLAPFLHNPTSAPFTLHGNALFRCFQANVFATRNRRLPLLSLSAGIDG
jgi:hypothetical protein